MNEPSSLAGLFGLAQSLGGLAGATGFQQQANATQFFVNQPTWSTTTSGMQFNNPPTISFEPPTPDDEKAWLRRRVREIEWRP